LILMGLKTHFNHISYKKQEYKQHNSYTPAFYKASLFFP